MGELSRLINIGMAVEAQLIEVGIETAAKLTEAGSRAAWLRIKAIDESACINRLYALEGAIRGVRWHDLPRDVKFELKYFYEMNKG